MRRQCFLFFCLFLLTVHCYGERKRREVHFPGYNYCGPGTSSARIAKNETGINGLDEACRRHDLVYDSSIDLRHRIEADIRLEHEAWARVKASNSNKWEKTAAWIVTNIMKMKRKWGTRKLRRMSQPRDIGTNDEELADDHDPAWFNHLPNHAVSN